MRISSVFFYCDCGECHSILIKKETNKNYPWETKCKCGKIYSAEKKPIPGGEAAYIFEDNERVIEE